MPITVAAIPSYVALEKGFWKEEGLEVKAEMFSAGRLALDALLAKSTEVMSVSETPLMHAILQGYDIKIVATVAEMQEVKAIGRRDHGIRTAKDFKGKRIATLPGTNSDYFMYQFLKKHGISLKDVKITNMAPPEMVTSLINGNIDAYFAWEPHIYYARKHLGDTCVVFPAEDLYHGRHCVAMNSDYITQHPDVVEKLIRGFIRAEKFAKEQPDSAMAIVAKITGLSGDDLKALWGEYNIKVQLDSTLVDILQVEGKWALSLEKNPKPLPDFKAQIYTEGLRKVRPSSLTIIP